MNAMALIATAVLACAAFAAPARAEPVTLTLTHPGATTHPGHLAAMLIAKRVQERSEGQVKVEIFAANQLGSATEVQQKVRLGVVDMWLSSPYFLSRYDKAFSVLTLPNVYNSRKLLKMVDDER